MKKIAINGFGRIGRLILRNLSKNKKVDVVAINDLTSTSTLAHLFKYDTAHGRFDGKVSYDDNNIIINGKEIKVFSEKDPTVLPWKQLKIDLVIECTGKFLDKDGASKHLQAGAKKVILSAPAKGEGIPTIVYNVNHKILKKADTIISGASCTTNALAPLANIINKNFGIKLGMVNTVHSYTADQRLEDAPHKDLRRARAAASNIVPTTTGAAKAIGLVIPELTGKMHGIATRVPVITGSFLDLTVELETQPSIDEINKAVLKGNNESIISNNELIVSSDIIGESHGCIFDPKLTTFVESNGKRLYKIFAWYDNEESYVSQLIRTLLYFCKL